ncbi:MAG: hypothetical protein CME64_00625 [Halobacteriovoraceae bacterium]|nr:hypothetical protein [Halobacteriovoraceae bacterium]
MQCVDLVYKNNMMNTKQDLLKMFSKAFAGLPSESQIEDMSIPKEYLDFEGFRLTESPVEKLKILFLGDFCGLGSERIKLSPKYEWMFHESDKVVINLKAPISIYDEDDSISAKSFLDFCDQIIPEKVFFNLCSEYFKSLDEDLLKETLGIIESVGATSCGAMVGRDKKLSNGLFLSVGKGVCHVKGTKSSLASFGNNLQRMAPIQINNKALDARSLGCFVSSTKSKRNGGLMAQIEFAKYEDWMIRKVIWEGLQQQTSRNGARLVV